MFNYATFNSFTFNGWGSGKRLNTSHRPHGGAAPVIVRIAGTPSKPRPGIIEQAPSSQPPTIDVDSPSHDVDAMVDAGYLYTNKVRRQPGIIRRPPRVGL